MAINLSGTNGFSGVDGSATTPALQGADGNTGVFFGTDEVKISTGGNQRLIVDSSGRLGIGTSTPQLSIGAVGGNVLHLAGTGTTGVRIQNTSGNSVDIYAGTDGFINQSGSGVLNFQLAGSTKATLTSTGLGIGTTSPANPLHIANQYPFIRFQSNSGSYQGRNMIGQFDNIFTIEVDSDNAVANSGLATYVDGTERMRIDSSGRLLVGTSSTSATTTAVLQGNSGGSTGAGILNIQRGQAAGASIVAGTSLGLISFNDNGGNVFALIQGQGDGASGTNDYPGRLTFSTTADGASSPTERMRIGSDGSIRHLTSGNSGYVALTTAVAGTTDFLIQGVYSATTVLDGTVSFRVFSNGDVQNTNNSYGAISDIKLKENIVDASSQWDDIKTLQVRNYNFKEGQTHTQIGLIAQEVELVSPGLVSESPDRDEEGNDLGTVTKSVNYSVLYMKAVKALQEAMERIEQLETEMAAVKAQLS